MVSKNGVEPLGRATLYSKCGMATVGKVQNDCELNNPQGWEAMALAIHFFLIGLRRLLSR